MESTTCDLCGSHLYEAAGRLGRRIYFRCENCGTFTDIDETAAFSAVGYYSTTGELS